MSTLQSTIKDFISGDLLAEQMRRNNCVDSGDHLTTFLNAAVIEGKMLLTNPNGTREALISWTQRALEMWTRSRSQLTPMPEKQGIYLHQWQSKFQVEYLLKFPFFFQSWLNEAPSTKVFEDNALEDFLRDMAGVIWLCFPLNGNYATAIYCGSSPSEDLKIPAPTWVSEYVARTKGRLTAAICLEKLNTVISDFYYYSSRTQMGLAS
jgi:hypothetical protein